MANTLNFVLMMLVALSSQILNAKTHYVSTNGTSKGSGAFDNTWDLGTAFKHPSAVVAGDTILLRGGIYVGHFTSELKGTAAKPITVMPYQQEIPIIDGYNGVDEEATFTINGAYVNFWGFHVTNSGKRRYESDLSSRLNDGIDMFGSNIKLINLMVYDNTGNGIGFWSPAVNSEIYGCLIFHNGYQGTSRGHGHGIYTQNSTGTKLIRDNVIFNGFQYGIHGYSESGGLTGFHIEGNICFDNGIIQEGGELKSNLLIGGGQPIDRLTLQNNHLIHPLNKSGKNLELGYSAVNTNATVTGNMAVGGSSTLKVYKWNSIEITNNTVVGNSLCTELNINNVSSPNYNWNNNTYFSTASLPFNSLSFDSWKSTYGVDSKSTFTKGQPTVNAVFVRPNAYQAGRAHVVVYNWQKLTSVQIDLSSVLQPNSTYSIYDLQNIKGQPIATGTFDGNKVTIPMNTTEVTLPNGDAPTKPTHLGIEFGLFLVLSNSSVTPPPTTTTDMAVYPNPTQGSITVDLTSPVAKQTNAIVYDMTGKRAISITVQLSEGKNSFEVDLAPLPDGIYFISVDKSTKKVIKRT